MKLSVLLCLGIVSVRVAGAEVKQPNFLVILGEAQGWASSSVQMDDAVPESKNSLARTPALEALAREGIRFANFYAASPRCMPTRAALFTGKSPASLRMTYIGEGKREDAADVGRRLVPPKCLLELPETEVTIAEVLKRSGYATAHFGKWHVGRANPSRHGFDENDGANSNVGPGNNENPNPKEAFAITERGADFMERQSKSGKPFYLQVSHYAGDGGSAARPETYAEVRRRAKPGDEKRVESAAMTEDMDATIAQLLSRIDALGIAGNTYVIYTADHGSKGRNTNAPLSNGKGTVWEGGIRVPLIVRGPGVKAGGCARLRASTVDLFPTIAALARIKEPTPAGVEGADLSPVLAGKADLAVKRGREEFVVHFPHYDKDELGPASALFFGEEKLIHAYEGNALHLYNVVSDRGERRDLAGEKAERAKALDQRLQDYLKSVRAELPAENAGFDPSKEPPKQQKGGHKKEKGSGL